MDTALPGSIFNKNEIINRFPNDGELTNKRSPLENQSTFKDYSIKEIKGNHFYNSKVHEKLFVTIVDEKYSYNNIVRDIQEAIFKDQESYYFLTVIGDPKRDKRKIKIEITIFISANTSYLYNAYNKTKVKKNEIAIFLEDNETDLVSPRSYFIKAGKKARKILASNKKHKKASGSVSFKKENFEEPFILPSFSLLEIEELILTGQLEAKNSSKIPSLLSVLGYIASSFSYMYTTIGTKIGEISNSIKETIKLKEKDWNPDSPDIKEGEKFVPFFLPMQDLSLNFLEIGVDLFSKAIIEFENDFIEEVKEKLTFNLNEIPSKLIPFVKKIEQLFEYILKQIKEISKVLINDVEETLKFFINLGYQTVNMANAFLCGLYNSIVDTIMAIPDIIGLLCLAIGGLSNAFENFYLGLEIIDEAIQLFINFNPFVFITTVYNGIQKGIKKVSDFFASINLEKVSYFIGACVGILIENLLGIIFSAGVANLVSITSKYKYLGKYVKIIDDLGRELKKGLDDLEADLFKKFVEVLFWLFPILRKGKDDLKKIIEEFFDRLNKGLIVPEKLIKEYAKKINLTSSELKIIENSGLKFIDIDLVSGRTVLKAICK